VFLMVITFGTRGRTRTIHTTTNSQCVSANHNIGNR